MTNEITYMTQSDLRQRIRTDRQSFAKLWQNLTDEQLTQRPSCQEDWSIKDLIAHIIWWEDFMIWRINDKLSGGDGKRSQSIDDYNVDIFEQHKDRGLDDILAEFESNLPKVDTFISQFSDEQINNPEVINISGQALLHYLIGDTFGHYAMHRNDLQAYVDSL
ncbi:MAG: hypothetical protein Phog2KO_46890 [Phototrophicaceae bacterium]